MSYNSPVALPQPTSTTLPMDYGQGLYQPDGQFVIDRYKHARRLATVGSILANIAALYTCSV